MKYKVSLYVLFFLSYIHIRIRRVYKHWKRNRLRVVCFVRSPFPNTRRLSFWKLLKTTSFHAVYLGSAWLARISLMASSRLLGSICNRCCNATSRGRIWSDGSCRLACCPQRTWEARQAWGQGAWLLLWWGNSTGAHRLWSSKTCVRVSLRCSATWGFATSLLPRTKSLPVGWVHSGGSWSSPMRETASGHRPCHSLCLSFFPVSTLFPWNACTTGGRQYASSTSLLWKSLSPGRHRMGKLAGKTDIGESAPCSKMGRAHVRKGGVLWM